MIATFVSHRLEQEKKSMKTRHIASCLAAALCFTALGCDEGAEPIDQPGPGTTGTTSQELIH